ncbi:hypothetical protein HAZT_HAZT001934 [Hyalella azteca]|uniref:Uncharacterized protein n=1 Tax=Hyalella azteca TaxID=294128 RepID=A0A6A0H0A6_HYAAZ|nr:hypothetical protein HAZT_HAZT001934 [Hyalella azteca]
MTMSANYMIMSTKYMIMSPKYMTISANYMIMLTFYMTMSANYMIMSTKYMIMSPKYMTISATYMIMLASYMMMACRVRRQLSDVVHKTRRKSCNCDGKSGRGRCSCPHTASLRARFEAVNPKGAALDAPSSAASLRDNAAIVHFEQSTATDFWAEDQTDDEIPLIGAIPLFGSVRWLEKNAATLVPTSDPFDDRAKAKLAKNLSSKSTESFLCEEELEMLPSSATKISILT